MPTYTTTVFASQQEAAIRQPGFERQKRSDPASGEMDDAGGGGDLHRTVAILDQRIPTFGSGPFAHVMSPRPALWLDHAGVLGRHPQAPLRGRTKRVHCPGEAVGYAPVPGLLHRRA